MKIVFCLRNYLPTHIAGTEIYVDALCRGLQQMGIETVIVKPGFDKKTIEEYIYNQQRVVEYPQPSLNDNDLITGNKTPTGLPDFKKVLEQEKPTIIHFHEISGSNGITTAHYEIAKSLQIPIFTTLHLTGYVCKTGMLRYKNKKPCDGVIKNYKCSVCSLHNRGVYTGFAELAAATGMLLQQNNIANSILPRSLTGLLGYPKYINNHRRRLQYIFTESEKVFVLSHWFKQVLLRNSLPENKITLLEKALPHSLPPLQSAIKSSTEKEMVRFIYLGRISKIKGLHLLLEALNTISCSNWQLDIYGQTGEAGYEEFCKELATRNNDKIFFKKLLQPQEVLKVLQAYDALVCPTVVEEMVGLVVMEAFAAGVPVIGSDSKGIAEQVKNNEDGILFKSGSDSSLADLLQKVLHEPAILQRLKNNIQVPQSFDIVARQVYNEYRVVMSKTSLVQ